MKNELVFKGQIEKIFDVMEGESSKGAWKKIEFLVVEYADKYPQSVKFSLFGEEKVDNFVKYNKEGGTVEVSFNFSCREYQGKFYTDVQAWRVWGVKADAAPAAVEVSVDESDDLPF